MAHSTGTIIGVGHTSIDDYKIGHAYIVETKPLQHRLCGVSPADCVEEDQTNNRGESFTILKLCTLVHAICKVYNIESVSVVIYYDIERHFTEKKFRKVHSQHWIEEMRMSKCL